MPPVSSPSVEPTCFRTPKWQFQGVAELAPYALWVSPNWRSIAETLGPETGLSLRGTCYDLCNFGLDSFCLRKMSFFLPGRTHMLGNWRYKSFLIVFFTKPREKLFAPNYFTVSFGRIPVQFPQFAENAVRGYK